MFIGAVPYVIPTYTVYSKYTTLLQYIISMYVNAKLFPLSLRLYTFPTLLSNFFYNMLDC